MNLLNELSENETNLLKNIGIKIEDRDYNQDEAKLIENDIIEDIFRRSSKNGDIQKANEQYSNICLLYTSKKLFTFCSNF